MTLLQKNGTCKRDPFFTNRKTARKMTPIFHSAIQKSIQERVVENGEGTVRTEFAVTKSTPSITLYYVSITGSMHQLIEGWSLFLPCPDHFHGTPSLARVRARTRDVRSRADACARGLDHVTLSACCAFSSKKAIA